MKNVKKILGILLILSLVMSMGISIAFADSYTITIANGVNGQTYTAYKVFDVTLADTSNPADGTYDAFAYSINSTSAFWDTITNDITADSTTGAYICSTYGLTLTPTTTTGIYNVTGTPNQSQIQALAAALNADTSKPTAAGSITNYSETNKTIAVTELGYYFMDSSMGSLCSLDTTATDVTIYEKNSTPTLTKQVQEDATTITVGSETSTASSYGAFASADIGQTVNFKLVANTGTIFSAYQGKTNDESTLGTGVSNSYVITDTLPSGMSYNGVTSTNPATKAAENVTVTTTVSGTATTWTLDNDYIVAYESDVLTITLLSTKLKTLAENQDIVITYGATVDTDAVIGGTGNKNTAKLKYTGDSVDYETQDVSATVYVSAAALYKYNSDAAELANAKFTMKTPENADMYFIQKNAGDASTPAVYEFSSAYASATTGATNTITTPASGAVVIYGLDTGTYTLTETEAPSGYNQLTATVSVPVEYASEALSADKTFTTSKSKTATFVKGTDDTTSGTTYKLAANSVIGIENLTGTELPSTGGIGTTIFYVVGALLVVGAGVVLVTRRKVDDDR